MHQTICTVFVCNKAYLNQFFITCNQLITHGKYNGNICLIIGDDLQFDKTLYNNDFIKNNNIIIKHFPDIQFPKDFFVVNNNIKTDGRHLKKRFQWHKLHLFNVFFKQWDYIFYIDCGINIYSDISPILNEISENTLLAHSDSYPDYDWKLHVQFDKTNEQSLYYFNQLNCLFNLNIDYFQTTMMLYDTQIIKKCTYDKLFKLAIEYPISNTNEQGILALYFTNLEPHFKQIKIQNETTFFYDYMSRNVNNKYIMLKTTNVSVNKACKQKMFHG